MSNETVSVRFDILAEYAEKHRLDFNELCRTVRGAIAEGSDMAAARQGYARRNGGAKIYCCYGMYADVGHDSDCENAANVGGTDGR
jgi:hypothetical protein